MTQIDYLQILADIHAQIVAIPRESAPHRLLSTPTASTPFRPRNPRGDRWCGKSRLRADCIPRCTPSRRRFRASASTVRPSTSRMDWNGAHLFVRTALHAGADHVCIVLQRERGNAWHRVEIDGVGVLEEENAVQIISLQPFLDDSVLPAQAKNHGKYAVEAEVNVAVAVRLLDDVALGVDGDLALEIANRGDAVLHHDVDLVLAHSEVVVLLQVVHGADCEKEKKERKHLVVVLGRHDGEGENAVGAVRAVLEWKGERGST